MSSPQGQRSNLDIRQTLLKLSQRIMEDSFGPLPTYFGSTLKRVVDNLEKGIPGLEHPLDQSLATASLKRASRSSQASQFRLALAQTVRGLAESHYDPQLWSFLGNLCWEFDEPELAAKCLALAVWINPGNLDAQNDLAGIQELLENSGQEEDDDDRFEDD